MHMARDAASTAHAFRVPRCTTTSLPCACCATYATTYVEQIIRRHLFTWFVGILPTDLSVCPGFMVGRTCLLLLPAAARTTAPSTGITSSDMVPWRRRHAQAPTWPSSHLQRTSLWGVGAGPTFHISKRFARGTTGVRAVPSRLPLQLPRYLYRILTRNTAATPYTSLIKHHGMPTWRTRRTSADETSDLLRGVACLRGEDKR